MAQIEPSGLVLGYYLAGFLDNAEYTADDLNYFMSEVLGVAD